MVKVLVEMDYSYLVEMEIKDMSNVPGRIVKVTCPKCNSVIDVSEFPHDYECIVEYGVCCGCHY